MEDPEARPVHFISRSATLAQFAVEDDVWAQSYTIIASNAAGMTCSLSAQLLYPSCCCCCCCCCRLIEFQVELRSEATRSLLHFRCRGELQWEKLAPEDHEVPRVQQEAKHKQSVIIACPAGTVEAYSFAGNSQSRFHAKRRCGRNTDSMSSVCSLAVWPRYAGIPGETVRCMVGQKLPGQQLWQP